HPFVRGIGGALRWLESREVIVQRERKRPCRGPRRRLSCDRARRTGDRDELLTEIELGRPREPHREDRRARPQGEVSDPARERPERRLHTRHPPPGKEHHHLTAPAPREPQ